MPKNTTCEVQGKNYTVGFTYKDVSYKNKDGEKEKVTLWCTAKDKHVTCKGKKCGSSLELTPVRCQMFWWPYASLSVCLYVCVSCQFLFMDLATYACVCVPCLSVGVCESAQ